MRVPTRLVVACCVLCLANLSYSQSAALSAAGAPAASPGYAQLPPVNVSTMPASFSLSGLTFDATTGAVVGGAGGKASITANVNAASQPGNDDAFEIDAASPNLPTIDGLNTLATFDGAFIDQAVGSSHAYRFTMIGNDPKLGGTTIIPANFSEVSLQLLNADGSVFTTVPFAPFEKLTLESPNFEPLDYRSGHGIEFADAIHRAEFYNVMKRDWHSLLIPKVVNKVTITVPYFVNVQLKNGNVIQARSYFTGTAPDGSTFVLLLSPLFDFFFQNEAVNEINLGNFAPNGINMTLFPNTFLFSLEQNQHRYTPDSVEAGYWNSL